MPPALHAKQYAAGMQADAQNFSCCSDPQSEPWAEDLDRLIKTPEKIAEKQRFGNKVYVFGSDTDRFVAYGMLGTTRWPIAPDGSRIKISYIPAVAVDARFQGSGFGEQIMRALIDRARNDHPDTSLIGLMVHKDNVGAQSFYEKKFGFKKIGSVRNDHYSMIRDMDD